MRIEFQRTVDRIAGTLICRILSLLPGARREPSPALKPGNILLILLSEMGSLVLAKPMLELIRDRYPDAKLFALVFEQNREVLGLLDVIPENHVFTVRNTGLGHLAADSVRVCRAMRARGIDAVIDCELFSRISSIYSYLSGAPLRAGFHRHTQEGLYRGDFINRPVLYNPYVHISQQFLNLAEALESNGRPRVKRPVGKGPAIGHCRVPEADITSMSARLSRDFPRLCGKKLVLVYPGGGLLTIRAWPVPHFCRLIEGLNRSGYAVGIMGMKRDRAVAHEILDRVGKDDCFDLTGYTRTLRELMALFHLASLLITNDGGPGHFASLTPLPSIIFFGPETPLLYGPLGNNAEVFYERLSCSPCLTAYNHRRSPCDGNNACLRAIDPERVLASALRILDQPGAEPQKSVGEG